MAARFKNYRQTENSHIQTPYSINNFVAVSPNNSTSNQTPMAAFKANSLIKQIGTNEAVSERIIVEQIKKVRAQYQIRILQLQNQVKYLKEEVDYKKQVHQRQLQNQKAVMQFQYTSKMRDTKNSLRQEFIGHLNENMNLKQKNKQLEEQIRLLKLRYERAQKYSKQIEQILSKQKIKKEEQIQKLQKQLSFILDQQKQNKQKYKFSQQQFKQLNINIQKEKDQKRGIQEKNKKFQQKINELEKSIEGLNKKLKMEIVEREQLRIDKDNTINQLKARLDALREQSVWDQVAFKKKIRQNKLAQIDQNISEEYLNSGRKSMNTIDVYRFDVQRQILLQKEMKKKFQFDFNGQTQIALSKTQPIPQSLRVPQIKKVNSKKTTKRNTSTDVSDVSNRIDSIPDSPQFGFKI